MFSTKMSHLKSSIEKKKNHLHDHSKQSSILQDHLTKSSTHKRIKLEKMISERVKPNTRRRPPSSCPIKLSTMNTTLKLGLLILCICPLLLLSDGSATNDHHNEEGSHLHPSDLIQQGKSWATTRVRILFPFYCDDYFPFVRVIFQLIEVNREFKKCRQKSDQLFTELLLRRTTNIIVTFK